MILIPMLSVFDVFKVGVGPSSSHTVGPMRAAKMFLLSLDRDTLLTSTSSVKVSLYGSLGATGRGHATDQGVILGLLGCDPESVQPATVSARMQALEREGNLALLGKHKINFERQTDILFEGHKVLSQHPNGMRFVAASADGAVLADACYFSVGGGMVVESLEQHAAAPAPWIEPSPYPFCSGDELLAHARRTNLSISQLVMTNECSRRPESEVREHLLYLWGVMQACVQRGFGVGNMDAAHKLPGFLGVRRRAPELYRELCRHAGGGRADPLAVMDWVNAFAMAVSEENAAGGRVVTAPTNGAAGVVPAVMHYYMRFIEEANDAGIVDFMLTAGAIGMLYKTNASISGAEVGCQGEVGVACSMAAAGLAAAIGATPAQVENAAEIGMEHNLGLTCDPVGGMVQIPCIERNAMGAVKAINAVRLAMHGDGSHYVSLDTVIKTMMQTGADMKSQYKETSLGGLAVNIVEC